MKVMVANEPPSKGQKTGVDLDGVKVSVRLAHGGPLDEYVHTVLEIQTVGVSVVMDDLVSDVEGLPLAPQRDGEAPLPFALDVHDKRFDWGASSWFVEMVLYIAQNAGAGVIGGLAWAGTERLARKWATELKPRGPHERGAFRLDDEEAVERSRWLISERFHEPDGALEVAAVDVRPPDHASVSLVGAEWIYSCGLEVLDGLIMFSRVQRTRR